MKNLYAIKAREVWAYLKTQDILFWLINIYLFLEYVRPQTLYPTINIFPLTKSVILLTLGLFIIRRGFDYVNNSLNSMLLIFFTVILLSSMFAMSPDVAFNKLPDFVAWVVIYYLIINIVNTEERFLVFMLAFLLFSFKMSQYSFRNWALNGFSYLKHGSGGGPGWFHNSGEFGIQMCIFLPLSAYFFFALKDYWSKSKKVFFFLMPFTALTGTISSSSRGAVIGAGAVLLLVVVKSKHKFKSILCLLVLAILIYSFMPEEQLTRFQVTGSDSTSITRLILWERGLKLASRYPVLGVGYENWFVAQEKIYGLYGEQVCHNIFIQCVSELGCLGLLTFIMMIVYTFINNLQTRKLALQNNRLKPESESNFIFYMAHGLDAALVGYLVSGFFVTVLYYPFFWINLAMTVALNNIAKNRLTEYSIENNMVKY
jgi:putative inorganic carbon (HCO3(-)) transporter